MGGFFQDVSNGLEKEVTCSLFGGICFADPTPHSVPTRQRLISQYIRFFILLFLLLALKNGMWAI